MNPKLMCGLELDDKFFVDPSLSPSSGSNFAQFECANCKSFFLPFSIRKS